MAAVRAPSRAKRSPRRDSESTSLDLPTFRPPHGPNSVPSLSIHQAPLARKTMNQFVCKRAPPATNFALE